jgi:predicted amidophosphoribosyltransferase
MTVLVGGPSLSSPPHTPLPGTQPSLGEESTMVCAVCGAWTDAVWWWCPECGGQVREDQEIIDLGAQESFPVEWAREEPAI